VKDALDEVMHHRGDVGAFEVGADVGVELVAMLYEDVVADEQGRADIEAQQLAKEVDVVVVVAPDVGDPVAGGVARQLAKDPAMGLEHPAHAPGLVKVDEVADDDEVGVFVAHPLQEGQQLAILAEEAVGAPPIAQVEIADEVDALVGPHAQGHVEG